MINRIRELKNKAIERANYYTKLDFPKLASDYTEFANILNEMENIVLEMDALQEEKKERGYALLEARDGEVCD